MKPPIEALKEVVRWFRYAGHHDAGDEIRDAFVEAMEKLPVDSSDFRGRPAGFVLIGRSWLPVNVLNPTGKEGWREWRWNGPAGCDSGVSPLGQWADVSMEGKLSLPEELVNSI